MIFSLSGCYVPDADDAGRIVVDVWGVGYGVIVHDRDQTVIRARGKTDVCNLWVRTLFREKDGLTLYAFLERGDRDLFDRILPLKGCGPMTAIRLLSQRSAQTVLDAAAAGRPDLLVVAHIAIGTATKVCDGLKSKRR